MMYFRASFESLTAALNLSMSNFQPEILQSFAVVMTTSGMGI
jgi:hypothetical protein